MKLIIATDGLMRDLNDLPKDQAEWKGDHPAAAAAATEFVAGHPDLILEQPAWPFNESDLTENITHLRAPGDVVSKRARSVATALCLTSL